MVKSGSCNTDNSTTATVIVNPTPDVNAITNQTVCAESTTTAITFTGSVNGTIYNWSNNTTSIGLAATGNSDISSFTAKNPGTTPLTATITVTPSYTNGGATCTGTSKDFTITVNPAATVNHVDDQTVCNNVNTADINFQSNQTGGTITYAWTNDNASIGLAGSGTGNIASFTGTNAGNDPAVANISVIPTYLNNSVSCPGPSNSFKITVNPTPAITNTFDNPTYCNGDNTAAGVTFTSNVTGATYSWTSSVDVGFGTSGNGNISSFTATNTTSAPVTTTVTVTPIANGCPGTSSTFTITVNPTATITNNFADPIAYTYCNNTTGTAINFTSDVAGATYAWTCSTDIGFGTGGTDNISSFTATNSTNAPVTATITVTPTANGCAGTSKTFKITVNPTPTISNTLNNVVYCNGASGSGISFTGPVSGETFSWTSSSNVGFGASGNGNIPTFTAANTSNVPVTATVTVTASANSCSNSSYNFTVTVNPTATITNTFSNPVYCNGSSGSGVSFSSNVSGATFSWTSSKDVGFGASGTGNIGAFTATNSTNSPVTTTIQVTPTANTCVGTAKSFTITVNPTPSVNQVPDQPVCNKVPTVPISFTSATVGTVSYNWTNSNTAIGLAGSGTGNIPVFTPVNNGTTQTSSTITVTPTANGCSGPQMTFNILVDPTPVAGTIAITASSNADNPALLCAVTNTNLSNGGTITLSGSVVGTVSWEQSTNGGVTWISASGTQTQTSLAVSQLTVTTLYRAVITSGSCTTPVYSNYVPFEVIPANPPTDPKATPSTICMGESSVLTADTGYPVNGISGSAGDFDNGASNNKYWNTYVNGVLDPNGLAASRDNTVAGPWGETNGPKVFSGQYYDVSDNTKFAVVDGANNAILESSVFNLTGGTNTQFSFSTAYNLTADNLAKVQISTDGGLTYNTTLVTFNKGKYGTAGVDNQGHPELILKNYTIDLSNYVGLSNLRIRFNYSGVTGSSWAVDNLSTPGGNLPINYTWGGDTQLSSTTGMPVTATPQKTGVNTYTIASTVGGCPGGSVSVNVYVNPLPTYGTVTEAPACAGTNATFTLDKLTPSVISTITYNINNGTPASVDVPANASGVGTFALPLTFAQNGQTFTITKITNQSVPSNSVACSVAPNISTTLIVYPLPTATISGDASVCQGDASPSITLTGNSGKGPYSFTYSINGVTQSTNSSNIPVSTTGAGTFVYSLISVADNGTALACSSNGTGDATVVVNAKAVINKAPLNEEACPESTVAFNVDADAPTGTIFNWQVSTDNGGTWSPISSSDPDYSGQGTSTLTVTHVSWGNTKDGYLYQTGINASVAACAVTSAYAKLTVDNVWHGYTNTDWNTASNWSDNKVPSQASCDSVIILKTGNQPVIAASAMGSVNHLRMRTGATLQVLGTLQLAGSITDDNMAIDATAGTIELNGDKELYYPTQSRVMQHIAGHMFYTPYKNNSGRLLNLEMNSPNSATVDAISALNDTLNITGTLSFGDWDNVVLHTGNNITLVSDANATARVADISTGGNNMHNNFDGWVEVERYLRIGPGTNEHASEYEFLATPTIGQTVYESWMEKGTVPKGYGTNITSPFGSGFDGYSKYFEMKYWQPGTNFDPTSPDWNGISSTSIPIYNENGYMIFVKGDRTVTSTFSPETAVTLRTKGKLLTYTKVVPTGTYNATSVGNPYASAIDLRKIIQNNTDDYFTIWKADVGGRYGYGAYITYTRYGTSDYETVEGLISNDIQSGQAFFVQSTKGAGSLTFNETSKTGGSNNIVFRGNSNVQLLRANLYYNNPNGTKSYADGMVVQFDDNFSSKVDGMDGRKFFNAGINLAMKRDNQWLVVEKRPLPEKQDTIFMNLTGAGVYNYRFVFVAKGLQQSGQQAYLEDHYLNTVTPLNMDDSTVINFKVENTAGSKAANRFDIIFKKIIVLPPAFTTGEAHSVNHDIQVNWAVIHEKNVEQYEVESSADGVHFVKVATLPAINSDNHNYGWLDRNVLPGYYYYRVKMLTKDGKVQYSNTMKVLVGDGKAAISIYPNPITNGVINLHFINQPAGKYAIRLMNQLGQVIVSKQIERMNGSNTESIRWDYNLAHGIYQLEILNPDGSIKVIKVIY